MLNLQNLAFKGGGVKGIAYAGAYKALQEEGAINNVKRIAGTSAGAIVAAIIALGYSPEEVKQIVGSTNFSSFMDNKNLLRIFTRYGIYKGDAFLNWMQQRVTDAKLKTPLKANATFTDLKNAGGLDLHVFTADISTHQLVELSYDTSPDVVVAEAVRASMSIPLFFKAWQFANNNPNDHYYVDGGMVYNYPLTIFDRYGGSPSDSLGLYLRNFNAPDMFERLSNKNIKTYPIGKGHIVKYIKNTVATMLDAQEINLELHPDELKRTMEIDDLGISPTDFNLSKQDQDNLFQSGYKSAKEFLAKQ